MCKLLIVWLAVFGTRLAAVAAMQPIVPGGDWRTVDGRPIEAHEGGVLQEGCVFYLYGTDRSQDNSRFLGVNLYSSIDLVHWTFVRQILSRNSDPALQNVLLERPKLFHNRTTGQYVLWFHYDKPGYRTAEVGYATCNTIAGDFKFGSHFRPNGHDSRDLGAFEDTDGHAYLICSTDGNGSGTIFRLNSACSGIESEVFHGGSKINGEGHSMIKVRGTYFWFASSYSGWTPNDNYYFTATNLAGPWTRQGFFVPAGSKTFFSQNYNTMSVSGSAGTMFFYMGDRWNPAAMSKSRLIWLPMQISGTSASVRWLDTWDIDVQTGNWRPGSQKIPDGSYKISTPHDGKGSSAKRLD